MINPLLSALIRRAILDLVEDTGGELNDEVITLMLNELGHRVARSVARKEIAWLHQLGLVRMDVAAEFLIVRSTQAGRDVANGLLRFEGVSRHKTGE